MRIGHIITIIEDRKFGFIRTEHFRDDVFFHFSTLKDLNAKRLRIGQEVEFEIDELLRLNKQKLEAVIVQEASQPLSHRLEEEFVQEFRAAHHPKARRRKPTWKARPSETEAPNDAPPNDAAPNDAPPNDAPPNDAPPNDSLNTEPNAPSPPMAYDTPTEPTREQNAPPSFPSPNEP
jgi:cold shock CspA family protein